MALDESREFVLTIDSMRSLSAIPTEDGATVVLLVEDPQSACAVEMTQAELQEFITELTKLVKEG